MIQKRKFGHKAKRCSANAVQSVWRHSMIAFIFVAAMMESRRCQPLNAIAQNLIRGRR